MERHRFDAGRYWQFLGSWPEDELQMSLIVLVTGLVTFAGSVGWPVDQALISSSFLKPRRKFMKSPGNNVGDSKRSLTASIASCQYSWLWPFPQPFSTILTPFLTILNLHLIWHLPNLQSVGRRFAVRLLGPRANQRTATSRADGERGAFNLCVYIICADTLRMGNWKWAQLYWNKGDRKSCNLLMQLHITSTSCKWQHCATKPSIANSGRLQILRWQPGTAEASLQTSCLTRLIPRGAENLRWLSDWISWGFSLTWGC